MDSYEKILSHIFHSLITDSNIVLFLSPGNKLSKFKTLSSKDDVDKISVISQYIDMNFIFFFKKLILSFNSVFSFNVSYYVSNYLSVDVSNVYLENFIPTDNFSLKTFSSPDNQFITISDRYLCTPFYSFVLISSIITSLSIVNGNMLRTLCFFRESSSDRYFYVQENYSISRIESKSDLFQILFIISIFEKLKLKYTYFSPNFITHTKLDKPQSLKYRINENIYYLPETDKIMHLSGIENIVKLSEPKVMTEDFEISSIINIFSEISKFTPFPFDPISPFSLFDDFKRPIRNSTRMGLILDF